MITKDAKDHMLHGYPRPQLTRDWESLNGQWQFAIDKNATHTHPDQVNFDKTITVPYAPETKHSGIADTSDYKAVWYRRTVKAPSFKGHERVILHFGAVDFAATVWVNGRQVASHEGGYTPFSADITDHLNAGGDATQTIIVRAYDNPADLEQNRGKQHWGDGSGIWYWRTTGIWQTVWWEVVPAVHIAHLDWQPQAKTWQQLQEWNITVSAEVAGAATSELMLEVKLTCNGRKLAHEVHGFSETDANLRAISRTLNLTELQRRWQIPDEPYGDIVNWLLWSPEHPNLIDAEVTLRTADGAVLDKVTSYTALRSFETRGRELLLNGRPIKLRLALDQGYWRESGMTAPDDAALEKDVVIARQVFNGVRKHNKLEDPRWLYFADKHGLLVWEELPSAYLFSPTSMARSNSLWTEAIRRDRSHPCIIAWVPINESWQLTKLEGTAPQNVLQQQFQQSIYYLTKALTGGGVVVGNDGWEMVVSDIIAIHDYDHDPERMRARYANDEESLRKLFANERPGSHVLLIGMDHHGLPMGLTEFGGIKLSEDPASWGYSVARNPEELRQKFASLMNVVRDLDVIVVFCYTELFDAYWEANGLFTMEREPKFAVGEMHAAVWGV